MLESDSLSQNSIKILTCVGIMPSRLLQNTRCEGMVSFRGHRQGKGVCKARTLVPGFVIVNADDGGSERHDAIYEYQYERKKNETR